MTQTIFPKVSRAFSKQRKEFTKARDAALSVARKGTVWRKYSAWLYCRRDGVFIDALYMESRHEEKTSVCVCAKPLELDSLFWRITGLVENERGPPSLRANGAFTCWVPPILEEVIDDDVLDPAESARKLVAVAEAGADMAVVKLGSKPFSELLEEDVAGCDATAAQRWGPTYVTSLIMDGRSSDAMLAIHDVQAGKVQPRTNFYPHVLGQDDRRDFFDLALEYIESAQ